MNSEYQTQNTPPPPHPDPHNLCKQFEPRSCGIQTSLLDTLMAFLYIMI